MKQLKLLLTGCLLVLVATMVSGQETVTYKTVNEIVYREGENLTDYMKERCHLDLYYPENKSGYTTIVWFHGGGITGGEKFIPEQWMEKGLAVVAVNYRLSPKVKSPEYIEDAAAAVAWVFKHIEEYGGSKDEIVVSGHSAGGYLAAMIGMDKSYLNDYDIDADQIAALVPFSGHTITHFTIRSEQGIPGTQPIIDRFAPLYHVRDDAPPLFLITGDREVEILGRYEENAYMYRMMKVAGHQSTYLYELDGFDHGGMAIPAFELTLRILNEMGLN
ncbi:alpha/beta hydrolase [Sunxiuqinia elliptica]|uniref:Acetyl esterase/lipase n=1 Tax=Sunxiuqinia elliptica TaxID=655355 RepID=A0A1I2KHY1_9BACT|nr:alpha/beta hydrolase [Sunxiuqinia elliptica]SFF64556.1 Acetyl esterase/lipase [Sunxiuqinia elliptica]